jgi:hypothetical protein
MSVPANIFNVGEMRPPFPLKTRRDSDAERPLGDAEGDASASVNRMLSNDLMWVRSPDFSGWLVKKGFRVSDACGGGSDSALDVCWLRC